jgi:hypothetical protein
LKEIFSAAFVFAILFYVAVNLGFNSSDSVKINPSLWIPACIKLNSYLAEYEKYINDSADVTLRSINADKNNLSGSVSSTKLDSIKVIPDSLLTKKDSTKIGHDSLFSKNDSLNAKKDTVDIYSQDSTARIQNFHFMRHPLPVSTLGRGYLPRFYAQPAPGMITRSIQIDSTGKYVLIKEEINGVPYKTILRLPLKEYIDLELALNEKEDWEKLGNNYELKSSKKELGQLIQNITNFEIPLPSVGVLSIFGPPKISLKIGGAIDIHGAWTNQTTEGLTTSLLGNTRNEPDFSQTVQVNVDGTIGDKLNIKADWNTERPFQYENQLKIKYTGYEDEIVQSVEAGNVSLQTSPLVGGSEALFGIKAQFKIGPLTLTTLASQKKGQIKTINVNGGATSSDFNLRAYNYSTNHYFLDTLYASPTYHLFSDYFGSATPIIHDEYRVTNIEVWKSVSTTIINTSNERKANAYINLPAISAGGSYPQTLRDDTLQIPGQVETGRFVLLTQGTDYTLHPETGFISFKTQIQDQDVIAVAYRVENGPGPTDDSYYGEFLSTAKVDTTQRLILKLVKPANLQPQFTQAWKLLLKNIYPVGGLNIKQEGFQLNIKYESPGQDPVTQLNIGAKTVKLLNAFGLDNVDQAQNPTPDDIFDFRVGLTVIPETGEIIFPSLEPFGRDMNSEIPDSLRYQSIYDTTKTYAQQNTTQDKWEITGKYSGTSSSTYQLGFNIVANSVRVVLDGNALQEGVDYTVDYNIGLLTIKKDAALVPGANLQISYEQNDLFQLASKTLLGARGVFDFSDKTKLGFSVLNLNQQSLNQKVRIGEEPLSNTIYGVDFNTSVDLPFFTKLLDKVFSTREMSTMTLSGEYAYIKPDPNTIKSTIPDDNGESIAYIDDFEGSKTIIPIGINYTSWKDISPPAGLTNLPIGITPRDMMDYKGKAFWFSITPPDVSVQEIWGSRKKVATQDQQVSVLDFVFIPDTPGAYNYWPDLKTDKSKDWGGMMQELSSTANNLVEQNVQYIEFLMNSRFASNNDTLYVDLGRISEDVLPNNKLDGESKLGLDVLRSGEDTGIDGLTDAQEGDTTQNSYLQGRAPTNGNKGDPSGDDFSFNQNTNGVLNPFNYFHINGTEGNAVLSDIGRIPDTEDLNRNGNLDNGNNFYRYAVPIDTTPNPAAPNGFNNKFIAAQEDNGWYLYRVPLKDTSQQVGSPSFSDIETIRVFATNATSAMRLRIAEFNLVGNQWQKVLPQDTVMEVSVINVEDNTNYTSPPGVFQERDNTRPDQQVYGNEQSLDLIIKDLPKGQSREAVKYLTAPLDVFNYADMKLFIHGDQNTGINSVSSTSLTDYNSEVYFRFGTDTNNYYEYRQPVRPGWNDIDIKFSELTSIKANRDSVTQLVQVPVSGAPNSFYAVRGNPTLTSVKFLLIGIYNKGPQTQTAPISGEVWVNELRVIGADNHPGWAYSFATSMKLADLGTVTFNIQGRSPYFHQLSDSFGSRIKSKNWSISTDLDVLKLLPFNMPGSQFRLSYSHSESLGEPLYLPGTDILVTDAAQRLNALGDSNTTGMSGAQLIAQSRTYNTSDTWNASSVRLKIPSNLWWIQDTFNSLTYSFSYNRSFATSPTIASNSGWQWIANLNYGLNLSPDYYFKPGDIPIIGSLINLFSDYKDVRFYYLPQSISWNITANRSRNTNIPRQQGNTPEIPIISRNFITSRSLNLSWRLSDGGLLNLSTTYSLSINSSLANLETDAYGNQRSESQIWSDILSGKLFGKDYQYQQSVDIKSNPRLPSIWNIDKYFSISADYLVNYQWNYDFRQTELGRSAGYNNRTTFGLTLRWKDLTDPLFMSEEERSAQQNKRESNFQPNRASRSGRLRVITGNEAIDMSNILKSKKANEQSDNLNLAEKKDTTTNQTKMSSLKRSLLFLRDVAQSALFDYETINFNFSSQNTVSESGLRSSQSGLLNFFGFSQDPSNGPSRAFMFGINQYAGPRAANGNLQDVFSQQNSLDFGTSRPLWPGAKLDLKWNVGWTINKSTSLTSDPNGNTTVSYISETGSLSRSFLSLPPVLLFKGFNNGIQKVHDLYNPNAADPNADLSNAFIKGFETLPLAGNLSFLSTISKYIPRPNWHITWDGLQNLLFFKKLADDISLDHAYTSTYTEGWMITPDGQKQIQTQHIEYGFTPLVGLNFTFKKLWSGTLVASIKYSTRTSYDLGISTRNIIESLSQDIGVTAGYSKSGFEIPLFGVSLKNDIEFNMSYTKSVNASTIYDMINWNPDGVPQDGTTTTIVGPTIKYTISSRVQLSIFYTRTTITPQGASRVPPSVQNQAGLDVHISIQ